MSVPVLECLLHRQICLKSCQNVGEENTGRPTRSVHQKTKTITISPHSIDKTEVTRAQYKRFLDETGYKAPYVDEKWADDEWNWNGTTPPKGTENHPVVMINWYDALEYCRWQGKDLPTEAQWQLATLGDVSLGNVCILGEPHTTTMPATMVKSLLQTLMIPMATSGPPRWVLFPVVQAPMVYLTHSETHMGSSQKTLVEPHGNFMTTLNQEQMHMLLVQACTLRYAAAHILLICAPIPGGERNEFSQKFAEKHPDFDARDEKNLFRLLLLIVVDSSSSSRLRGCCSLSRLPPTRSIVQLS